MSIVAQLRAQAQAAAQQAAIDMSQASTGGGGERRVFPAGYAFAQLVEVVEFGKHPQEFGGKAKDPALEFRLGFAIWGGDPANPYNREDGTPNVIRTWDIKLSNNEKAKAKIAFDKLNYKGTAKSFPELLGEKYLIKIDVKASKADATKKFNDIDLKGTLPPFDPVSRQPYAIPEAPDDVYRLFLWSLPTKAGWDSLFLEGSREDGTSKNYLQEKCLAALDFPGSALEQMLRGSGAAIPSPEELAAQAPVTPAAPPVAPSVAPAAASVPPLPVPPMPADIPFDGGVPTTLPQAPAVPAVPVPPAPSAV